MWLYNCYMGCYNSIVCVYIGMVYASHIVGMWLPMLVCEQWWLWCAGVCSCVVSMCLCVHACVWCRTCVCVLCHVLVVHEWLGLSVLPLVAPSLLVVCLGAYAVAYVLALWLVCCVTGIRDRCVGCYACARACA